jgi:hypothetical protein
MSLPGCRQIGKEVVGKLVSASNRTAREIAALVSHLPSGARFTVLSPSRAERNLRSRLQPRPRPANTQPSPV